MTRGNESGPTIDPAEDRRRRFPYPADRRRFPYPADPRAALRTGCVLLAFALMIAGWSGLLVVVAGQVVPGWALAGAVLVVPVVVRLIRAKAPVTDGTGPSWVRTLLSTLATTVTALGVLLGAAADTAATYHVLEPAGPDGCRAVVREVSFLFAGSGDVYAVGSLGVGRRMGSWTADDGYQPIASGTYRLEWHADGGLLTVGGRNTDPVMSDIGTITC
ncbi:hypothetical protein [Micromonospora cathayae]|uniref:Ig-like domain-containing protein n=1 Tax=Micromonospora cathayae TaxID=3028804 RepID=A0ABY7ZQT1_9ACTN|nr:hypothetical protein [Micromonospora sp. HUAS 3]WDZ85386.1 hypothetical protein PVK37_02685 [Micromonospora sp. HUAS 3]